jgi:hypothetical protein
LAGGSGIVCEAVTTPAVTPNTFTEPWMLLMNSRVPSGEKPSPA